MRLLANTESDDPQERQSEGQATESDGDGTHIGQPNQPRAKCKRCIAQEQRWKGKRMRRVRMSAIHPQRLGVSDFLRKPECRGPS